MALALNGTVATGFINGAASGTLASGTFTTTVANCVIVAMIATTDDGSATSGPFTVSSISGGGLTWTRRGGQTGLNSGFHQMDLECWYAIAAGTFSSAVTATFSGVAGGATITVFAFSGANTAAPFDANGSLPAQTSNLTATANAVSATISTTNANTAIIGHIFNGTGSQTSWTDNAGFSDTANIAGFSGSPNFAQAYSQGQYGIVSSVQSGVAVGFTPNSSDYLYYVDAIQAAASAAAPNDAAASRRLFTPAARGGPARGLRRTEAFPLPVTPSVALTASAKFRSVARAGVSVTTALGGRSSIDLAGRAGIFAPQPTVQIGTPQGFLFKPGAGPTWNLRGRAAFTPPPSGPTITALFGATSVAVKLLAAPQSSTHIAAASRLAVASREAMTATGGLAGRSNAAVASRETISAAAVLRAQALVQTSSRASGALSTVLAAASLLASRGGATLIGKVALGATAKIATFGRIVQPGAIALFARTVVTASARAAAVGKVALSAAVQSAAGARAGMLAKAPLAGATRTSSAGQAGAAFKVALSAATLAAAAARATSVRKTALGAATQLATSVQGRLTASMSLAAAARVGARAQAKMTGLAPLTAVAAATLIRAAARAMFSVRSPQVRRLYPRTIEVHRSRTVAGPSDNVVGLTPYSGMQQSSTSAFAGEDVLYTAIPASIQAKQTGRKKDSSLPGDAVFAPTWYIFVPKSALPKGAVRDRDIIVDDESYRYEVAQAYWNILGWRIVCIRLEA
ncbi:hypothetical protein [Bradyrhizobium sp. ORS 86]|uniref:hypothetical protein n=1 Tax=Bradyrhizobium sp. ORS 86 TaxID=1685970 RepID=UPI00388D55B0